MKRKHQLLALAVAGIFAAPASVYAQQQPPSGSSVQIYGTLNLNFQNAERGGATAVGTTGLATLSAAPTGVNATSRNAVSTDSSNIGFRGRENLGGGLAAVFQIETSANIDGQNLAAIGNRNSKVGLAGAFGEIFFGNWDTPFKAVTYGTKVGDPFLSTDVTAYQSIMSSPGFKVRSAGYSSGVNTASYDGRASNTVAYWTREYNGLAGKVAYSANEGKTATRDPYLWSLAVNYNNGPLSVLYAYERHEDAFGLTVMQPASTGTSSQDSAQRLGAGYKFGNTTASILFERLDYSNSGTVVGVTSYQRDAWQIALLHEMGPHKFKFRYDQAQDGSCGNVAGNCATNGLGATQWALGYGYALSKRSEVYAFYTRITNKAAASYTFSVAGNADVTTGAFGVGSDPTALALGIRHTF